MVWKAGTADEEELEHMFPRKQLPAQHQIVPGRYQPITTNQESKEHIRLLKVKGFFNQIFKGKTRGLEKEKRRRKEKQGEKRMERKI